jgi:histidyl-tRNA synthetase
LARSTEETSQLRVKDVCGSSINASIVIFIEENALAARAVHYRNLRTKTEGDVKLEYLARELEELLS